MTFGLFSFLLVLWGSHCFKGRSLMQQEFFFPVCDQNPCLTNQLASTPLPKQSFKEFLQIIENLQIINEIISSDALNQQQKEKFQDADYVAVIFAPTDNAFNSFFENNGITKEEFLADSEFLNEIVNLHIVPDTNFQVPENGDEVLLDTQANGLQLGLRWIGRDLTEVKGPGNVDYALSPARIQLDGSLPINSPDATQVYVVTQVLLPETPTPTPTPPPTPTPAPPTPTPTPPPTPTPTPPSSSQLPICDQVPCKVDQLPSTVLDIQSFQQFVNQFGNLEIMSAIVNSSFLNIDVKSAFLRDDFLAVVMVPSDRWFEKFFEDKGISKEDFLQDQNEINQFIGLHLIPSLEFDYPEGDEIVDLDALFDGKNVFLRLGQNGQFQVGSDLDFTIFANVTAEISFGSLSKTESLQVWILDTVLQEPSSPNQESIPPPPTEQPPAQQSPPEATQLCDQNPCLNGQLPKEAIFPKESPLRFLEKYENVETLVEVMNNALGGDKQVLYNSESFDGIILAPTDDAFTEFFQNFDSNLTELLNSDEVKNQFLGVHFLELKDFSNFTGSLDALYSDYQVEVQSTENGQKQVKGPGNSDFVNVYSEIFLSSDSSQSGATAQIWVVDQVILQVGAPQILPAPSPEILPKAADQIQGEIETERNQSACLNIYDALDVVDFTSEFNKLIKQDVVSEELIQVFNNDDQKLVLLVPNDVALSTFYQSIDKQAFFVNQDDVNNVLMAHVIVLGEQGNSLAMKEQPFKTMSSQNISFEFGAVSLTKVKNEDNQLQAKVSAVVSPCSDQVYIIFMDNVLSLAPQKEDCPQELRQNLIPFGQLGILIDCESLTPEQLLCFKDQCSEQIQQLQTNVPLSENGNGTLECYCEFNGLKCAEECSAN